jgi:hypothetical protein
VSEVVREDVRLVVEAVVPYDSRADAQRRARAAVAGLAVRGGGAELRRVTVVENRVAVLGRFAILVNLKDL